MPNILIHSHPPEKWWVKLADFGISKRVEDCTGPTTKKGTPGFVPPEFHRSSPEGEEPSNDPPYAADVWALGEVTFRMMTDKVTFPSTYDLFQFIEDRLPFPLTPLEEYHASQDAIDFVQASFRLACVHRPEIASAPHKLLVTHGCLCLRSDPLVLTLLYL